MNSPAPLPTERTVFLVGCARSGTSIFGELLAAHPAVAYLFEVSDIWNAIFPDRDDDRLEREDAEHREAVERLHRELAGRVDDPSAGVILEKNPKHALRVGFLDAAFPGCRFLHLVRDGRDVVSSLMFRNRGSRWGHLRVPGWKELLERYPEASHARCAHQWRAAVKAVEEDARDLDPARLLRVRYEDLVSEPVETATSTLNFLGLEVTPEVLEVAAKIQDSTRGSYHARKQVRHYVDNHSRRIGRYEENLTPEQIEEVEAICGDVLDELGYR